MAWVKVTTNAVNETENYDIERKGEEIKTISIYTIRDLYFSRVGKIQITLVYELNTYPDHATEGKKTLHMPCIVAHCYAIIITYGNGRIILFVKSFENIVENNQL